MQIYYIIFEVVANRRLKAKKSSKSGGRWLQEMVAYKSFQIKI